MPDEPDYRVAAAEFFRLQRRFLIWNVALLVFVPVIVLSNRLGDHLHEAFAGTLFIAFLLAMFYCLIRGIIAYGEWLNWRCPRCGKIFRGPWYWKRFSPWECYYCGLVLTPSWWRPAEPFWEARPSQSCTQPASKASEDAELRK